MANDEFIFLTYDELMSESDACQSALSTHKILYLGDDFLRLKTIKNKFGVKNIIDAGMNINKILCDISVDVQNIDNSIIDDVLNKNIYAASRFIERSPYGSDLHLNLVRSLLLLNINNQKCLIVCDNYLKSSLFIKVLTQNKRSAHTLNITKFKYAIAWTKRFLQETKSILSGFRFILKRIWFIRQQRKNYPLDLKMLEKSKVFFMLWADEETFPKNNQKIESATYFGGMPKILEKDGKETSYIVSPLYWAGDYQKIIKSALESKDITLLIEDCWTYGDVITVFLSNFFSVRKYEKFYIQNFDLTEVIKEEFSRDKWSWSPVLALLYEKVPLFLKANEIQPSHVLSIFENHSWEKMTRLGFRKFLPKTKLLSCVVSPFNSTYINFSFSRQELTSKILPDAMLVCGQKFKNIYEDLGFSKTAIFNVGAIRQKHFLEQPRNSQLKVINQKKMKLLCATNSNVDDCCELILKVLDATKNLNGIQVIANFHPLTDRWFIDAVKEKVDANRHSQSIVEFVLQNVQSLIEEIDILLYTDTNAAFEALAKGVITVHVGRDVLLDYDTIPDGGSLKVHSVEELNLLLQALSSQKTSSFMSQKARLALLDDSLGPVDEDELIRALSL